MSANDEHTPETLCQAADGVYAGRVMGGLTPLGCEDVAADIRAHAAAWEADVARLRELLDDARHGRWARVAEMDAAIKQRPG